MVTRFEARQGLMSFREFMDLALHDPEHGAYGAGVLKVGRDGDFVTSPSMGRDFAALLAVQVCQWLDQLHAQRPDQILTLVEVGPGEGDLAADLITEIERLAPPWLALLRLALVERNPGMAERQRRRLAATRWCCPLQWTSLEDLAAAPVHGVVLAHELLDAFPVERLVVRDGAMHQCVVQLHTPSGLAPELRWGDRALPEALHHQLRWAARSCAITLPPVDAPEGWTTEWHTEVRPWLENAAAAVSSGVMLVIDYAHAAARYYTAARPQGTLLAYRRQQASPSLLENPGDCDLTAHLCLETLIQQAAESGWGATGHCRQGEALLSLGLSHRLHSLQTLPGSRISEAFSRREALLRLVDPAALGSFFWLVFNRTEASGPCSAPPQSRCLEPPVPLS